jgi:hypothetical protein
MRLHVDIDSLGLIRSGTNPEAVSRVDVKRADSLALDFLFVRPFALPDGQVVACHLHPAGAAG